MEIGLRLTAEQEVEYKTVVLAGLLHDIGKFVQRIEKHGFPKHPLASIMFIDWPEVSTLLKKDGMGINLELLKTLVQHHHESFYFPKNQQVQTLNDPHERALAYMVSRADNFSSFERDDEEDRAFEYYKNYRLYSTFALINITGSEKTAKHYQLNAFNTEAMFPIDKDELDRKKFSYEALQIKMIDALKNFNPGNFDELFNGFLTIFKKFLWAVPSDTWKKRSDISLFDHLSTTSALAASLYLFHSGNFVEEEVKNDEMKKFLLVGGDLSGIQDFLFEIHQQNPRKLSKTLRGRSFLLSLLVEMTSLKILKALNLPYSARLMSSGGRFVILAPNCDWVKETLAKLAIEIEEEFFRLFLGKLTLALNFDTVLNGIDMKLGKFKDKINENNAGLIRRKLNKNLHLLETGKYREILDKPHGHSIQENGVCKLCGVYPNEKLNEEEKCLICNISEKLGAEIVQARYIHFNNECDSPIFKYLDICVDLSSQYKPGGFSYALEEVNNSTPYRGSIFYSIANYLPVNSGLISDHNDDENSLCHYCKRNDLQNQCPVTDRQAFRQNNLSFECMAAYSPYDLKGKGVNKLAVFKADIDNLGFIAQYGFDNLDEEETSKYSVSRYTFLSRMIDSFFQYDLKQFIKEKYPMIYTVYAGGDDLLLIGPWREIVNFADEFYGRFKKFVGNNPDITLSAGISLLSASAPVPGAAEKAHSYLELSKDMKGKNAVTVFDTTVHWDSLPELLNFAKFLDNEILDEASRINVGFLYRLFKYRRMFMDSEEGKIEGLRFHSLMNYDIKRNIEQKKGEEIINKETLDKLKPLYATGDALNKEQLRNLKIPLYIALLKNRGGK